MSSKPQEREKIRECKNCQTPFSKIKLLREVNPTCEKCGTPLPIDKTTQDTIISIRKGDFISVVCSGGKNILQIDEAKDEILNTISHDDILNIIKNSNYLKSSEKMLWLIQDISSIGTRKTINKIKDFVLEYKEESFNLNNSFEKQPEVVFADEWVDKAKKATTSRR